MYTSVNFHDVGIFPVFLFFTVFSSSLSPASPFPWSLASLFLPFTDPHRSP